VGGLIYSVYSGPSVLFSSVASVSGGPLQVSECAWTCGIISGLECLEISRRRGCAGVLPFESG
jgi:hypothetical protein